MLIYNELKNKVPKNISLKERENDGFLIIESEDLRIYYLNETAKMLVKLSNGQRTIDEIKREFLSMYDVDEEVLEVDIVDLIRDLQWKNLIRIG